MGYEGDLVSSGALQTIERALIFRESDNITGLTTSSSAGNLGNTGVGGGFGDRREKGVRIRGNFGPQFDYQLGVFSGFGERQNTNTLPGDVSDQKSIIGRVVFRPSSVNGLQLGLSAGKGNQRFPGAPGPTDRKIYNGFVTYKKDKITYQGEYTRGDSDINLAAPAPATSKEVKAFYGSLGYLITPKLELVGRYDNLKREFSAAPTSDSRSRETTLGVNYYIKGNNAKIQANVVKIDNKATAAGPAGNNDSIALRTQFQIGF